RVAEKGADRRIDVVGDPGAGSQVHWFTEDPVRDADRVAPDVEQRAAAQGRLQADVLRIRGGEAEARLDMKRLRQAFDELAHRGLNAVDEGLHQMLAQSLRSSRPRLGLPGVHPTPFPGPAVLARL